MLFSDAMHLLANAIIRHKRPCVCDMHVVKVVAVVEYKRWLQRFLFEGGMVLLVVPAELQMKTRLL